MYSHLACDQNIQTSVSTFIKRWKLDGEKDILDFAFSPNDDSKLFNREKKKILLQAHTEEILSTGHLAPKLNDE